MSNVRLDPNIFHPLQLSLACPVADLPIYKITVHHSRRLFYGRGRYEEV